MEEVRAYIESGILELYVLGDISAEERLQVEEMARRHPEVKAELDEIAASLELFAGEHEIEPNAELRDRVLNSLLTNLADDRTFTSSKRSTPNETPVVPISSRRPSSVYKYAFAACFALLVVSVAALFNVYNKMQALNERVAILSSQNQQYSKTVNFQNEQLTVYRDTAYKIIKLQSPKGTADNMMVAWSPKAKKVMVDLAGMKLPATDAQHQYQLWAIVAGKPVDLGVFDGKADSVAAMKVMKSIDAPQAFAVTLEQHGGSPTPHLEHLMVIANI